MWNAPLPFYAAAVVPAAIKKSLKTDVLEMLSILYINRLGIGTAGFLLSNINAETTPFEFLFV